MREPQEIAVPVAGGELTALRWPADAPGAPLAVLVHGITANAMAWARVAGALAGEFEVCPEPHIDLCAGCPGRRALCVHPEELTGRELPAGTELPPPAP